MSLEARRRAISVQDLLCRNVADNSCRSPASNTEPSTASLSSPELSLDHGTQRLSSTQSPSGVDIGSTSAAGTWRRHSSDNNRTDVPESLHPLELSRPGTQDNEEGHFQEVGDSKRKSVRGPWRIEEDRLLIELVGKYGPRHWSAIATHFPRRTGKQARERWMNQLNPALKKKNWSAEEDRVILRAHASLGNKWSAIANLLPGRTDNSVKNRYNSTLKRAMKERSLTSRSFDIDEFVESLHAKPYVINPSLEQNMEERNNLGYHHFQAGSSVGNNVLPDLSWADGFRGTPLPSQSNAPIGLTTDYATQDRWNMADPATGGSYRTPFSGRQSSSLPDIRGRISPLYPGYREDAMEPLSRIAAERDMGGSGRGLALPLSNEVLRTTTFAGGSATGAMVETGRLGHEERRYRRHALSDDNRFPARAHKSITKGRTGRMNSF